MTVWTVVGGLALFCGIVMLLYIVFILLFIPAYINMHNGFGYWYNALRCLGFGRWLDERDSRRRLKF